MSMGAVLLAAGDSGQAIGAAELPDHDPPAFTVEFRARASDIEIHAKEILRMRVQRIVDLLAGWTRGRAAERDATPTPTGISS